MSPGERLNVQIVIRYQDWPDAPQWTVEVINLKSHGHAIQNAWSPGLGLDYCLAHLGLITLPNAMPTDG